MHKWYIVCVLIRAVLKQPKLEPEVQTDIAPSMQQHTRHDCEAEHEQHTDRWQGNASSVEGRSSSSQRSISVIPSVT